MTITQPELTITNEQGEQLDVVPFETTEDPNTRSHIIVAGDNPHIWEPEMTAHDVVDLARMQRVVLKAVCGYEFVPKHDPMVHDLCNACVEAHGKGDS